MSTSDTIRERLASAQEQHAVDCPVKVCLTEREHETLINALNIAVDYMPEGDSRSECLRLMSRLEAL